MFFRRLCIFTQAKHYAAPQAHYFMKKIFLKILNIEPNEYHQVLLLLQMGFLTGVFLATYDVTTMTLFVNNLDEEKDLPLAVMATGVVGIVFTYIFSFLQSRIPYTRLSVYVLLVITATVAAIRLGYGEIDENTMAENKPLIFLSLVLMGPFDALVLLIFWGTIARMFTIKQQKRIVAGVDVGKMLATLFAFFTIPIVSVFLSNTADMLIISAASAFAIILVLSILVLRTPSLSFTATELQEIQMKSQKRISVRQMFKDKYIVSMMLFIVIATIAAQFVDYSFLNATAQQYPSEKDLQNFLAVFEGITLVLAILVQSLVTDWIEEMYGLRTALLINPILLLVFTVVAALLGVSFGFTSAAPSFILFFMAIAMSKLFTAALKDSVDEAVFKFFYFPVDASIRLDVMARMDGMVKVTAGLIGGVLLFIVQYFHFSNLLLFTLVLLPIIGAWYLATNNIYARYRDTLRNSLVNTKNRLSNSQKINTNEVAAHQILLRELQDEQSERSILLLKMMERIEPGIFEEEIAKQAANSPHQEVRRYALQKIESLQITGEGLVSPDKKLEMSNEQIRTLVKSRAIQDRMFIAKCFPEVINPEIEYLLGELLRDTDIKVRLLAIRAARKLKKNETWMTLIELLASPIFGNAAAAALIAVGDDILPVLESAFHKSGQQEDVMFRIVQIYGRIGTAKALDLLWNKVNYPDAAIVEQVLLAFSYNNIKVPEERATLINHIIEVEIGDAVWDIAALTEISPEKHTEFLRQSLKDEIDYNFDSIFTLLSLLYDPQSIQLVKENLESELVDSQMYAIELLDLFVSDELKPKLFPLLEGSREEDILDKMQEYFPRERLNSVEVLKSLISRGYSYTNRWTRACAIYALGHTQEIGELDELIANLFHPDPILHETAAWAIYTHNKALYEEMRARLPKHIEQRLEYMISGMFGRGRARYLMPMRIQKTMFIREIGFFQEVPSDLVSEIVELIEERYYPEGHVVVAKGTEGELPLSVVAKGQLGVFDGGVQIESYSAREIYGEDQILETDIQAYDIIVKEDAVVFEIDKSQFYDMLIKNRELAAAFIKAVGEQNVQEIIEGK